MNMENRPSLSFTMRGIAQKIISMYENKNDGTLFFRSQNRETIPYTIYSECAYLRKKKNPPQKGKITFFPHEYIYHYCSLEMIRKYLRKAGYAFIKVYTKKENTFLQICWNVY